MADQAADVTERLARLEVKIDSMLDKIDFGDRSTLQVVKMHEERTGHLLELLASVRADLTGMREDYGKRLKVLEDLRTKLIGVAIGVSVGSGGLTTILLKALNV
jgi:hypothetical protein